MCTRDYWVEESAHARPMGVGGDVLMVLWPIVLVLFFVALFYCFWADSATTYDGNQIRWDRERQQYVRTGARAAR